MRIKTQEILDAFKPKIREIARRELEGLNKRNPNFGALFVNNRNGTKHTIGARPEGEQGTTFAGIVRAMAATGGVATQAESWACKHYGSSHAVVKALGDSELVSGGIMVGGDISNEVIELLRPRSVVRQAGARVIKAPRGTKTFPRIDSTAIVAYTAENKDIVASQQTMGGVQMTAKKLAALVPISNELMTFSGGNAELVMRDDLVAELSRVEDSHFLRGTGLEYAPKGLRYWAESANITPTNGTSAAQIEQDIVDLMNALDGSNVNLDKAGFVMSTRSKNKLFNLRDGNGNLIFPEVREGKLFGLPLYATNNVPTNLGGGTQTEVYLVAFDQVLIGEVEGIRIETSNQGSYLEDSVMVSAFSRDQTLIRIIMQHDISVRHPEAVAVKTAVAW